MKFQECGVCQRRRGGGLDEETKATHNRECRGCNETFRELTRPEKKQGSMGGVGKRKKHHGNTKSDTEITTF
jgi:hypothetical protein